MLTFFKKPLAKSFLLMLVILVIAFFYLRHIQIESFTKIQLINQNLDSLSKRVDELYTVSRTTRRYVNRVAWFQNGKDYMNTVAGFYLTNIRASVQNSTIQVTGFVANTESISKSYVRVQAAIPVSDQEGKFDTGDTEIDFLISGVKVPFTITVPSTVTKVDSIGIAITNFRM